jgi:AcrR family transcriptional regulator
VLLGAAESLAQEQGAAAVSVRTVAEAAGTSTRAVYSLFGAKAGLLDALAGRFFELLAEAVDAVPSTDDPVADVVTASLDGFRRTALGHPALYAIVFLQAVPDLQRGPRYQQSAAAAFGRLVTLVGRVEAAGAWGPHGPEQAARAVHALTEGLATVELRGGLAPAPEAVWRSAVTALLRGLNASMQPG